MFELLPILLLVGALMLFWAPQWRRVKPGAHSEQGTLLVTGVSPCPQEPGSHYVTIVGVLHGPTVAEYEVYYRTVIDTNHWPKVGDLFPVIYRPTDPNRWEFMTPL